LQFRLLCLPRQEAVLVQQYIYMVGCAA
jgi:hypothetical protein